MVEEDRDRELVERARKAAHNRLGRDFAEKATDALCLAVAASHPVAMGGGRGLPAGVEAYGLEELGPASFPRLGPAPAVTTVVEFEPPAPRELAERAAAKVVAAGEEAFAEDALTPAVRQAGIEAARDEFYRSIGPIRDRIERSTAALTPTWAGPEGGHVTAGPVQACWLNHTVRAASDPTVIGDVAAESAVTRIDVPRRLEPETGALSVTLEGAASVRAEHSLSGLDITVAVIDSEADIHHPALADRIVHRRNYTNEPFGTPGPHGTAVAGFVGAASDQFSGVAPGVTIYNYKVLATSSALNSTDFEGSLAIQHALEDGMRVANCSWRAGPNGDGHSREARACDEAWRLGLTVVKSAGNAGPGPRTLTTPADAEGVVAVGATDAAGLQIADYSSRGSTTDGRHRPHLVAPGGTLNQGLLGLKLGGGIGRVGAGTSYAAPHITGLLALLLQGSPQLTPDEQRKRLLAACNALNGPDVDSQGAGLIDPAALLP